MGGFIRGMLGVMCGYGAPKLVWVLKNGQYVMLMKLCYAAELCDPDR